MIFCLLELSRIRTYIGNLEGFRPNPLDDEPIQNSFLFLWLKKKEEKEEFRKKKSECSKPKGSIGLIMGGTGFEPVAICL